MSIFDNLKNLTDQVKDKYKDKRNEKGFHYLQHSGASILQQANMGHSAYIQRPGVRKNEIPKSFRERMIENRENK